MEGLTRPQAFQQPRHYMSSLDIRRRCPRLPRQENGADCGIFTLMYQQALSKWYGAAAGHDFTEEWLEKLIMELQAVTQPKVKVHRMWLRCNMHTWWPQTVQKDNLQVAPTVRMQQREKRRLQRTTQRNRSDPSATNELNLAQDDVDPVTDTDEDQPAAKAPQAQDQTSGILGTSTDDSRTQTEQRRSTELDIMEEAAAKHVDRIEQDEEPWLDQEATLAAGPSLRPQTLTPISNLQRQSWTLMRRRIRLPRRLWT
jgi:hypothetical protein